MQFRDLNIIPEILKALEKENYSLPTPIQEKAIPAVLDGKDLLGCAQTGTGKTAAFAIPTLQNLSKDFVNNKKTKNIRALVLTPTRELALQIFESFNTYGRYMNLKSCVIFGGVAQKPQEEKLKQGVDILIATPGRLLDLMNQKQVDVSQIKMLILDEADRMLDMGFIHDVRKIIHKTPAYKQTLLFSATMPQDIANLSKDLLRNPVKIEITPVSTTVELIEQYVYYVDKVNKKNLILHVLEDERIKQVLVFSRTKHGADRIVKQLIRENISASAIHGDKSQGARQNALNDFKNKKIRVLVATDIAARGIDIEELSHVINYDLPEVAETYVHRIGRTGRAGLSGVSISFCDFDEIELLENIQKLIRKRLKEIKEHPFPLVHNFPSEKKTQPRREPKKTDTAANEQSDRRGRSTSEQMKSKRRSTAVEKTDKGNSSHKNNEIKKKFRMAADGTLKEKRSNYRSNKKNSIKDK
ncbi:MAG: DEAD/DEAH box helicase [Anaerocolumna sp.]